MGFVNITLYMHSTVHSTLKTTKFIELKNKNVLIFLNKIFYFANNILSTDNLFFINASLSVLFFICFGLSA